MARNPIKAALVAEGVSLTEIARSCGVSVGFVSRVVAGSKRSLKVEREIARRLDKPADQVFPDPPQRARRIA